MTIIKDKTKEELVKMIMDDLKANEYDSRDAVYELAEECLNSKSKKKLLSEYFSDIQDEDDCLGDDE